MREVSSAAVPLRIARGAWLPVALLSPLPAALWMHYLLLLLLCCRQDYQSKYYVPMLLSALAGDYPRPMRAGPARTGCARGASLCPCSCWASRAGARERVGKM